MPWLMSIEEETPGLSQSEQGMATKDVDRKEGVCSLFKLSCLKQGT